MSSEYKERLRCVSCGHDCYFESNHDESYILCMYCLHEYLGGYNELLLLNRQVMEKTEVEEITQQALHPTMSQSFRLN